MNEVKTSKLLALEAAADDACWYFQEKENAFLFQYRQDEDSISIEVPASAEMEEVITKVEQLGLQQPRWKAEISSLRKELEKIKVFAIPVSYQCAGTLAIWGTSAGDALANAEAIELGAAGSCGLPLPDDAEYLAGSFVIDKDEDLIEEI